MSCDVQPSPPPGPPFTIPSGSAPPAPDLSGTQPKALSSPFPRVTHCPCRHSTSFFSVACGLLLHNGRLLPLCLQSLRDSFHRHGGVSPRRPSHSPLGPRCAPTGTLLSPFPLVRYGAFLRQRGGTPPPTIFPRSSLPGALPRDLPESLDPARGVSRLTTLLRSSGRA
jgi:hypothetical protein